jgi:translation initiation factor IF-3
MARELGLDLVEIAPQERPPVCRIMDYGKHKYLAKKKQKQNIAHEITMKEVRLRPKTDDHDRDIKLNQAERFLAAGHKVQFTMLFRGRERQHRDIAMETFNEITTRFAELAKIERPAKFENKRMTMVLAANKKPPTKPSKPKVKKPKPVVEKPAAAEDREGGERPSNSPVSPGEPLPKVMAEQPQPAEMQAGSVEQ